jgi:hypothetical protein
VLVVSHSSCPARAQQNASAMQLSAQLAHVGGPASSPERLS